MNWTLPDLEAQTSYVFPPPGPGGLSRAPLWVPFVKLYQKAWLMLLISQHLGFGQ